jgi:hypothetical protein
MQNRKLKDKPKQLWSKNLLSSEAFTLVLVWYPECEAKFYDVGKEIAARSGF